MLTSYVYILASKSRRLYTGLTANLERRIAQHQRKEIPGFTAQYKIDRLVYYELYGDIRVAIAREKQIKGWLRAKKIALIESENPRWLDLSEQLFPALARTNTAKADSSRRHGRRSE